MIHDESGHYDNTNDDVPRRRKRQRRPTPMTRHGPFILLVFLSRCAAVCRDSLVCDLVGFWPGKDSDDDLTATAGNVIGVGLFPMVVQGSFVGA